MAVLSWWSDCLVDSVNERDLRLLNSHANPFGLAGDFLEGHLAFSQGK